MNGEIAFEPALRERVALLDGLDIAEVVDRIIGRRLTLASGGAYAGRHDARRRRLDGAGLRRLRRVHPAHRRHGRLSGAPRQPSARGADGRLTGKVAEPILGRAAKAEALKRDRRARSALDPADAIAVGDGANDLDMIRLAGPGVALHAKPIVAAQAQVKHRPWRPDRAALSPGLSPGGVRRMMGR